VKKVLTIHRLKPTVRPGIFATTWRPFICQDRPFVGPRLTRGVLKEYNRREMRIIRIPGKTKPATRGGF